MWNTTASGARQLSGEALAVRPGGGLNNIYTPLTYVREPRALTSRSFVSGYFIYLYWIRRRQRAPRARSKRQEGESAERTRTGGLNRQRAALERGSSDTNCAHTHNGTHGTHAHEHGTCLYRMILLARTREARWSGTRPSPAAPSGSQEGVAALVEAVRSSASCTAVHAAALASV